VLQASTEPAICATLLSTGADSSSSSAAALTSTHAQALSDKTQTTTLPPQPVKNCWAMPSRSEEHTSELQSPGNLVCRLLLEKKKYLGDIDQPRRRRGEGAGRGEGLVSGERGVVAGMRCAHVGEDPPGRRCWVGRGGRVVSVW